MLQGKLVLETMDIAGLVRVASDVGISCPVGIMMGFPDETEAEILQSVELAKRLVDAGAKYCSFYIPIPFPVVSFIIWLLPVDIWMQILIQTL